MRDIEAQKAGISLQDLEAAVPVQQYKKSKKYGPQDTSTPSPFDSSEVWYVTPTFQYHALISL